MNTPLDHEIGMTLHQLNSAVGDLFELTERHPEKVALERETVELIAHGLAGIIAVLNRQKAA